MALPWIAVTNWIFDIRFIRRFKNMEKEREREGGREGNEYRDGNTKMEKQLRVFEVCAFLRGDGIRNSRVWRDID